MQSTRRLCILLLWASALASCESSRSDYFGTVRPKHDPDILWMNNGAEPQWIDPGKCSDSNGGDVIWNTFAGLVEAHPATLEPMPDIAHNWTMSDDGAEYTFFLRDTDWSDGYKLTAHDFEWSWKRVLDPATASKYASIAYVLKNGAAFNQRALFLRGVDPDIPEVDVRGFMESAIPVERLEACSEPPGFFVYPDGDVDEIPKLRQHAVETLNKGFLAGQRVELSVVDSSIVGVEAVDNFTLRVRLENPIPYFLNLLSFYTFMPVPRHVIEQLKDKGFNPDLWTRPRNIVSNGAYVLKEWKFRQYMLFEKNPRYWNADRVRTPQIKAYMVESYNTCLNLYRTGEIDFPGGNTSLPGEFMDHLRAFKDFSNEPYLGCYFYWFNMKEPPLDNPQVRKALSLAIDRQSLVEHVTRAGQIPTADLVPDGLAGYDSLKSPLFDPDKAKRLLAAAGYPNGIGFPHLTLIYNTSEGHKQVAEAAQQMWKDHLEIDVRIENQEWKVYLKNLELMNFQMARMGWIGDYPDPYTFLELLSKHSGNNHAGFSDKHYDALLTQASRTTDPADRLAILRQAEQYAVEQQPLLPLYVYTRSQMIKPYVKGIWSNYQDRHAWKYIWIDERWYDRVPQVPSGDSPPPMVQKS